MNAFTETLFRALLGWIQGLVQGLWSLFNGEGAGSLATWFGNHWLTTVILLCVIGIGVDIVVWFFRWRPYYVWGTKLRKLKRFFRREEKKPAMPPKEQAAFERGIYEPVHIDEGILSPPPVYRDEETAGQNTVGGFYDPEPDEPYPQTVSMTYDPWAQEASAPETESTTLGEEIPPAIYARPRKADYQEEYVAQFAPPTSETVAVEPQPPLAEPSAAAPVVGSEQAAPWADAPTMVGYVPLRSAEPRQEVAHYEKAVDEELDGPVHPGIDYQEMSKRFGWDEASAVEADSWTQEPPAPEPEEEEGNPDFQADDLWDTQGLETFSPYAPPPVPASVKRRERGGRTNKRNEGPLRKAAKGISTVAKKAGKIFAADEDEQEVRFGALPPPVDKRHAFHGPVYPPSWRGKDKGREEENPDFQEDDH